MDLQLGVPKPGERPQLPAGERPVRPEGAFRDRRGDLVEQPPRRRGELVGGGVDKGMTEPLAKRQVRRARLDVGDTAPADLDLVVLALVLVAKGDRPDEAEELGVVAPAAPSCGR